MLFLALAPLALVTGLLLGVMQEDPMQSPAIVALLSLLAVPALASLLTTGLIRMTGIGVKPQSVVYLVCLVIVGILAVINGGVPLVDASNPAATVVAWQVWVAAQTKYTQVLYDTVFSRIWPTTPPA